MRLHNRQIKAAFWNDPDLLQWPRDKRLCYLGLSQLADDSGCLEDSPFAFKVNLFPSPVDGDVTPELIQEWLNELVQQGKLIRYQAGGKACLFMSNFHKHQHLHNPSAPTVPLPSWVSWQPYSSNPRAGRYIITDAMLMGSLQNADALLTESFQPEPEPEPEPETLAGMVHPSVPDGMQASQRPSRLEKLLTYHPLSRFVEDFHRELQDPEPVETLMAQVVGIQRSHRVSHVEMASLLYEARKRVKGRHWTNGTRAEKVKEGGGVHPNRARDFLGILQDLVSEWARARAPTEGVRP